MRNPEFTRNLWLSFSRHKLIAMPVILGLSFFAIALSEHHWVFNSVYSAATTFFIFIVWLWGARNANQTIVDELRDKTWDQQRMSALDPWSMTWGKLLGATAINWYGGAICLAVAVPAGILGNNMNWIVELPSLVTTGLMTHAALIALNMHSGQVEMRLIQRGGLGWISIIITLLLFQIIINESNYNDLLTWWGIRLPTRLFILASTTVFAACFVFAAWRVISNALQVRTMPWSWPLFGILMAFYFAGFSEYAADHVLYFFSHTGLLVAGIMTYITLFTEPARLPDWNRLRLRQQNNDWRGWLQNLPLWPGALLLAFCFALLGMVPPDGNLGYSWWHDTLVFHAPLAFAFMLLRDAGILLFFSFSPKGKRPGAVALVYIVVLDLLLPFLFNVVGLDALSFFFFPIGTRFGETVATLVMATQAVIALGLVGWRLQQAEPRPAVNG